MPYLVLLFLLLSSPLIGQEKADKKPPSIAEKTAKMESSDGFFTYYWNETDGKIYLEIDQWGEEFLYVNSLAAGLGSNDIGLDRNQLGNNRVVRFERVGPKVLLLERNLDYRAVSDNVDEQRSVADAFAQAVLAGFPVVASTGDAVLIDLTPMLMQDAHGVANRLKRNKQGSFKVDAKRSAVYLDKTKNFPDNSEFEVLLGFSGEATGSMLRSVAPTPNAFSVRQHHSFVRLPDDNYRPRVFDPRSGYSPLSYADYATPIDQPLVKKFIRRHRLEKKDPSAAISEAVEPIVYYLDRGAPEPIRSALIEGAQWWNQAYEAAGYRNAFQVKLLPEDADPLDVRYNVINWVHRSTRGWSYGSSVTDPRTGEIIKGHVLLGSLRVRQDFLIAQGLVSAYENGESADPRLLEMALARLRQLSAHEVGHTLGLAHNFAASVNDRSSVMDYPHPYVTMGSNGEMDFGEAYEVGIGDWDKRTILYGYQDFPAGTDEATALQAILEENENEGFLYVSDPDSRAMGSPNAQGHLWDNGEEPISELNRLMAVRRNAIDNFSLDNIAPGTPMSSLESVFVPVYLMHRYQVEAASKLLGGYYYDYGVKGGKTTPARPVPGDLQMEALEALLSTLDPGFLSVPARIQSLMLPQAYGYRRDRELFKFYTEGTFDPAAAAEAAAEQTLSYVLHPARLARISVQGPENLDVYLSLIGDKLSEAVAEAGDEGETATIARTVHHRMLQHLMAVAAGKTNAPQVRAAALGQLQDISKASLPGSYSALVSFLLNQFKEAPGDFKAAPAPKIPDGSPIGCGEH